MKVVSCRSEQCLRPVNMMTSIPVTISKISRNNVKRHHLKKKTFSTFFIGFLACKWSLEHFEKKDESDSLIIFEIIESQRGGYLNV